MRGWDIRSDVLFSYVNCEGRVPKDHPLRAILRIVDQALAALSPEFEGLYAKFGRPSLAQASISVPSTEKWSFDQQRLNHLLS